MDPSEIGDSLLFALQFNGDRVEGKVKVKRVGKNTRSEIFVRIVEIERMDKNYPSLFFDQLRSNR